MNQFITNLKNTFYRTTKQFVKFGIVGIINTIITLSIIFILSNYYDVHYIISNAIGYIAGFINSFIMNKFWTFKSKGNVFKESIWFIIVFLISYGIQLIVLYYLHGILNYNENLSQILSMIVYTVVNFLLNKFLTFR
ncbi:MAG: polysaccharide biosynthesis protein GtrA [Leptospiraceae bacterium]|nr:MAG: polysaccharide biosynthesis protein GtrA [Leptospiraceae bacterium]